jgi:hypothetical protein
MLFCELAGHWVGRALHGGTSRFDSRTWRTVHFAAALRNGLLLRPLEERTAVKVSSWLLPTRVAPPCVSAHAVTEVPHYSPLTAQNLCCPPLRTVQVIHSCSLSTIDTCFSTPHPQTALHSDIYSYICSWHNSQLLTLFENRALKKMFGLTGRSNSWLGKLHRRCPWLCFSANTNRAMTLEGSNGRGFGYVWKRMEIHTEFWWAHFKVTDCCKT